MPKQIRSSIIWLILAVAALATFVLLFDHAFPVASIELKINKQEAIEIASDFINQLRFSLEGFDKTIIFHSDYDASVYLQKTQGINKANQLIRQGIPVWFWKVRWFKELEKEGFIVRVDPSTGEIIYFHHRILEDEQGADLSQDQAKAVANKQITYQGIDLQDYELKDSTTKKQKRRTDYSFAWEKKGFKVEDATLRVSANIYGDKLGRYQRYLKVPEEFGRYLSRELSFGRMLSTVTTMLKYLLIITAVFVLFFQSKQTKANWKLWAICAGSVALLGILSFLNDMPLAWNYFPDTMSKGSFVTESLSVCLTQVLSAGLIVLACGALGELSSTEFLKRRMPLYSSIKNKRFNNSEIMPIFVVGYSLGFIFLGYITLFYLIGTKFFNIWIPPETEYSNIFGTILPFLFPLTVAITAAVEEELIFRAFAVSFLKRFLKKTWLALLIPAVVWGFAHSFYHVFPTYIRGIELTIFGIVFGVVFLKYGLETVIIAHFVINATLAGLPLLRSGSPHFVATGVIVIALAFVPIILLAILKKKQTT